MGDGQVALILDVLGIAQGARIVSESRERNIERLSQATEQNKGSWQTLLLVGVGNDGRLAIPLSMVARLEEFAVAKLERSMDREVVQYRGQILPLVRVATILGCATGGESSGAIQVVVCNSHGKSVGLVVERIVDIVETNAQINTSDQRESLIGSTIIQQQVTDLLDVSGVIRAAQLELCAPPQAKARENMSNSRQFCTFYLNDLLFGVEVQTVQEVIRYQAMTRVPTASRVVSGLINLRGQIITAIDLRRQLGMPDRSPDNLPMNVVVRTGRRRREPAG